MTPREARGYGRVPLTRQGVVVVAGMGGVRCDLVAYWASRDQTRDSGEHLLGGFAAAGRNRLPRERLLNVARRFIAGI
jgi:hypothetical protein